MAENKNGYTAKPCLVLGTGFHRWVLGDSLLAGQLPLVSWQELILETAREMGVAMSRVPAGESMTLLWEKLLNLAQSHGVASEYAVQKAKKIATSGYELKAKSAAVRVIQRKLDSYPHHSNRVQLPTLQCWGSVVSLNFDSHWLGDLKQSWKQSKSEVGLVLPDLERSVTSIEVKRLNNAIKIFHSDKSSGRVWFPNGHVSSSESLRLGLRDFGFQPTAIFEAFKVIKDAERRSRINGADLYNKFVQFLDGDNSACKNLGLDLVPLTWVAEIIYRPVIFAGAGMSESEVGLWWLMVQRERNLANVPIGQRPKAYILLHENDGRRSFWQRRPCGIEPIFCSDWDSGWQVAQELAEKIAGK